MGCKVMIVLTKKQEKNLLKIVEEIKSYDVAVTSNEELSKEYRDGAHRAFQLALKIIENNRESFGTP